VAPDEDAPDEAAAGADVDDAVEDGVVVLVDVPVPG
jgi:hypothetical protein